MSKNRVFVDNNVPYESLGRFRTDRKLYLDHQQRDIGAPVRTWSTTSNPTVMRANTHALIHDRLLNDAGEGWYTHMHSWMVPTHHPTSQHTGTPIMISPEKLVQLGYVHQNQVMNPTTFVYQSVVSAGDAANMRQAQRAANPPPHYPAHTSGVPSIRG